MELELKSFPMDRDAAKAALPLLQHLIERLPDYPPSHEIAEGLPDSTGALAEVAVDDYDDGNGAVNFVQALVIATVLGERLTAASHSGDLVVDAKEEVQAVFHHGSLTIEGSLGLVNHLIVLGDLRVTGRVHDLEQWSRLIVTGNLECKTIRSGGPIWAGGRVTAEVVYLGHHGKIFCGDGMQAELVVASPEAVGIDGDTRVRHEIGVDLWRRDEAAALVRLTSLLTPEAVETFRGVFVPEKLLALAEAGKPYLRDPAS
jgi:hypothetical protein